MGNAPSQEALANVPSICGFPWKCIYDPLRNICHPERNLLKASLVSSSLSPFPTPGLGWDASGAHHRRQMEDRRDLCLHTSSANTGRITASGCRRGERLHGGAGCDLLLGFVTVSDCSGRAPAFETSSLNITVWSLIGVWALTLNQNL